MPLPRDGCREKGPLLCSLEEAEELSPGNPQFSERVPGAKVGFCPAGGKGSYQYFEVRPPSRVLSEEVSEG